MQQSLVCSCFLTAAHALAAPSSAAPIVETDGDLYRITLWQNGDPGRAVTIVGGRGQQDHAEARVRVRREERSSSETHWAIDVEPTAGYGVHEIEFPLLVLKPISGPTRDRLIVPHMDGRVIDDPHGAKEASLGGRPRTKRSLWYGVYGSKQQGMQMLLYEDGERGVMVWTPDGETNIKDFEVSRDLAEGYGEPGLRCTVHHFPRNTGQPGVGWQSPYPVVTTLYEGGWYSAARRYREWALKQKWCAKGTIMERISRGDLPKWYARNAMWATAINHNNYRHLLELRGLFTDGEIGLFLTKWQRRPFDNEMPEYFPPDDEAGYGKLIRLQEQGFHIFPYMNVHLCSADYHAMVERFGGAFMQEPPKGLTYTWPVYRELWGRNREKTGEFQEQLRRAWQRPLDERLLARIHTPWFGRYDYIKPRIEDDLRRNWGKDAAAIDRVFIKTTLKPLCRASRLWQDAFVSMANRNLKHFGTDGQYLDQLTYGGLFVCFARGHGHEPGFGCYPFDGTREIARRIRAAHPDKVLFGECVQEAFADLVQENYCISPAFYKYRVFPLFSAVYQGYTSLHEWPVFANALDDLKDFASAMAVSIHLGHKVGAFTTMTTQMALLKPEHRDAQQYLKALVAMKLATMDVFAYGERLRDPHVHDSPTHTARWYHSKLCTQFSDHAVPVVEASAWRSLAEPSKKLLLLSNSGAVDLSVRVTCRDLESGAALRDLEGDQMTYAPETPIAVRAFSWRALLTKR